MSCKRLFRTRSPSLHFSVPSSFKILLLAMVSNGKNFVFISSIPSASSLHSSSQTFDKIVRVQRRFGTVFMTSCFCKRSRAEFLASRTYDIKSTLFMFSGEFALRCSSSTLTSYLRTIRDNILRQELDSCL